MKSKWLRRASWTVGGLALLIGSLRVHDNVFGGQTRQRLPSPDGHVIAEVNESDSAWATDVNYVCVLLRTKFNPLRHCVFGGGDEGARLSISWIDSKNLLIKCEDCSMNPLIFSKLTPPYTKEDRWHEIAIHYDIW
jgi:hypothetical protein